MSKSETVSTRMPKELLDKCDFVAKHFDMTRSKLILVIVERVCDNLLQEIGKDGKCKKS